MRNDGTRAVRITMRTIALSELKPAGYNPRKISEQALRGLAASIGRFGLVQPIVWNRRTGNVVSGHQRLRVLIDQGATETDVVEVDLDETAERALNVSQNNPNISGEYEDDALQAILRDLSAVEYDMAPILLDSLVGADLSDDAIDDIDLGDGQIDESEIQDRLTIFVPRRNVRAVKAELRALAERFGGGLV